MHSLLISLLSKRINKAILKFSTLPEEILIINDSLQKKISGSAKSIVDTYVSFFRSIGFIPYDLRDIRSTQTVTNLKIDRVHDDPDIPAAVHTHIKQSILNEYEKESSDSNGIIPIHFLFGENGRIFIITGFGLFEKETFAASIVLNRLDMPFTQHDTNLDKANYIFEILEAYPYNEGIPIKQFVLSFNRCYNQFQKDCKLYLGTTFYDFFLKIKMMNALDDLMFTGLNAKEIAFKNNFPDYGNLHRHFKSNNFPLQDVPRFYKTF